MTKLNPRVLNAFDKSLIAASPFVESHYNQLSIIIRLLRFTQIPCEWLWGTPQEKLLFISFLAIMTDEELGEIL